MENRRPLKNRGQRNFDFKKPTRGRTSGNGQGKTKSLDPNLFIKKGIAQEEVKQTPTRLIEELEIHPSIIRNLLKKGYKTTTEIQDKTLEAILGGRNLMGLAQTGTGKTAAFLTPIVNNLLQQKTMKGYKKQLKK